MPSQLMGSLAVGLALWCGPSWSAALCSRQAARKHGGPNRRVQRKIQLGIDEQNW